MISKNAYLLAFTCLLVTILIVSGSTWIFNIEQSQVLHNILFDLRIPKILTAFAAGGLLALCGLILQTYFQNPLAGPFVLGIHGGASLGVALWVFIFHSMFSSLLWSQVGLISFSLMGSLLMMVFIVYLSTKLVEKSSLMIVGLLMGFFTSGLLSIFAVLNSAEQLKTFYIWTLGSFQRGGLYTSLFLLLIAVIVFFWIKLLASKLNLLLLGDDYAQSLGVSLRSVRIQIIIVAALIVGVVTSLCGPIAFVGLMSAHLVRLIHRSADHSQLVGATFLMGANLCLIAEFAASGHAATSLPINATLSLLGIPLFLILYLIPLRSVES